MTDVLALVFVGAAERSHQHEFEGEDKEAEGARGEVSALREGNKAAPRAVVSDECRAPRMGERERGERRCGVPRCDMHMACG